MVVWLCAESDPSPIVSASSCCPSSAVDTWSGPANRSAPCHRDTNFLDRWIQGSICLCFTITIYCLSICLVEGFCVLIPALQSIARKFRTCEWFQRPSDSSASSRIYVFAGSELQCHRLFICSCYVMGICRLSPVFFSRLCANTSLISWKEVILYFYWMLLQEKDPHPYKSLKENGINHAKIDGCKMHDCNVHRKAGKSSWLFGVYS